MDKYQKYALGILIVPLFYTFINKGSGKILAMAGFLYVLIFLFHRPLVRLFTKVKRPLLAYGIAVLINGLIVEVLAYFSNLDTIHAGEKAYLFASSSLAEDLLISLPYYIVLALVYVWAVKKYKFTTFQLGFIIWLFWAINVDEWIHLFQLVAGGPAGIIGFIFAGVTMLFTLHAPILFFESRLAEAYPNRVESKSKYFYVFLLQYLSLIPIFVIAFLRFNILPNF